MDAIGALRQRWQAAEGCRDALEAEAEARVRRWVWTTHNSVRWRFEPLYGERTGESPGRILAAPPDRLRDVDAYGYDEQGRLVLARLYRGAVGDDDIVVAEHDGSRTWTSFFDTRGGVIRVGLVDRDDDARVTAVTEYQEEWGDATWWQHRFVWHDGRVTEIHKLTPDAPTPERRDVEYDEHGDLMGIRLGDIYEYRRPEGGVGSALRRFQQALPTAVDLALGDRRPFALALLYDAEQPIPPTLIAGSRADFEADPNPAEWEGPELPLPFGALAIEVGVLAGAVGREEAEDEARAALNRAAKRLNREPPEALADGGVVFAVDVHLEHLDENLRAALPAARLHRLGLSRS
jgi:hypothetical protein